MIFGGNRQKEKFSDEFGLSVGTSLLKDKLEILPRADLRYAKLLGGFFQ